jgi:hypothetical protein
MAKATSASRDASRIPLSLRAICQLFDNLIFAQLDTQLAKSVARFGQNSLRFARMVCRSAL